MNDTLQVGDRVTWQTINHCPGGIVESIDGTTAIVRLPSGKVIEAEVTSLTKK